MTPLLLAAMLGVAPVSLHEGGGKVTWDTVAATPTTKWIAGVSYAEAKGRGDTIGYWLSRRKEPCLIRTPSDDNGTYMVTHISCGVIEVIDTVYVMRKR